MRLILISAALAFAAPAFADDMHDHGMGHDPSMGGMMDGMAAFGEPGDTEAVSRTIDITGREYAFDPIAITVKAGETVRFVFKNEGQLDHEFSVGDAAFNAAHREMMARMSEHHGMDDHGPMHGASGNIVTAKPGETKELVWHFTKVGAFEIACNLPGHAELGMVGTITVE